MQRSHSERAALYVQPRSEVINHSLAVGRPFVRHWITQFGSQHITALTVLWCLKSFSTGSLFNERSDAPLVWGQSV